MLIQNIQEFLSSLSLIQNLAIFNISIGTLILNALITIITIFYSDFSIDYFRLENKFPRLSKYFKIRKNFKQYYFFFSCGNIVVIFIAVVVLIYVNYLVLIYS